MIEEKLGAFLLALIFLSFTISLIPMSQIISVSGNNAYLSFSDGIAISLAFGSVELLRANVTSPYAYFRGIQLSSSNEPGSISLLSGKVQLYIPEEWEGNVTISMLVGSVTLRGVKLGKLIIKTDLGIVRGSFFISKGAELDTGAGIINAELGVPYDSGLEVTIRSRRFSLEFDEETIVGSSIEKKLWEGSREVKLEARARSADISIFRVKG